ncbi:MAG: hypothetical protein AAGF82_04430 [Pseudomonadota bacterium]
MTGDRRPDALLGNVPVLNTGYTRETGFVRLAGKPHWQGGIE